MVASSLGKIKVSVEMANKKGEEELKLKQEKEEKEKQKLAEKKVNIITNKNVLEFYPGERRCQKSSHCCKYDIINNGCGM